MEPASYLHVTDEFREWEPVLRTQDWDLDLGIRLEVCGDVDATVRVTSKRHFVGIGRSVCAVDLNPGTELGRDANKVLPWLMRHRSLPSRPLLFLLATPQLAPWFPLWWEAGAAWIATEKHQIRSLVQLVARTRRLRPPVSTEQQLWHEMEVGQLPWHDEN